MSRVLAAALKNPALSFKCADKMLTATSRFAAAAGGAGLALDFAAPGVERLAPYSLSTKSLRAASSGKTPRLALYSSLRAFVSVASSTPYSFKMARSSLESCSAS